MNFAGYLNQEEYLQAQALVEDFLKPIRDKTGRSVDEIKNHPDFTELAPKINSEVRKILQNHRDKKFGVISATFAPLPLDIVTVPAPSQQGSGYLSFNEVLESISQNRSGNRSLGIDQEKEAARVAVLIQNERVRQGIDVNSVPPPPNLPANYRPPVLTTRQEPVFSSAPTTFNSQQRSDSSSSISNISDALVENFSPSPQRVPSTVKVTFNTEMQVHNDGAARAASSGGGQQIAQRRALSVPRTRSVPGAQVESQNQQTVMTQQQIIAAVSKAAPGQRFTVVWRNAGHTEWYTWRRCSVISINQRQERKNGIVVPVGGLYGTQLLCRVENVVDNERFADFVNVAEGADATFLLPNEGIEYGRIILVALEGTVDVQQVASRPNDNVDRRVVEVKTAEEELDDDYQQNAGTSNLVATQMISEAIIRGIQPLVHAVLSNSGGASGGSGGNNLGSVMSSAKRANMRIDTPYAPSTTNLIGTRTSSGSEVFPRNSLSWVNAGLFQSNGQTQLRPVHYYVQQQVMRDYCGFAEHKHENNENIKALKRDIESHVELIQTIVDGNANYNVLEHACKLTDVIIQRLTVLCRCDTGVQRRAAFSTIEQLTVDAHDTTMLAIREQEAKALKEKEKQTRITGGSYSGGARPAQSGRAQSSGRGGRGISNKFYCNVHGWNPTHSSQYCRTQKQVQALAPPQAQSAQTLNYGQGRVPAGVLTTHPNTVYQQAPQR